MDNDNTELIDQMRLEISRCNGELEELRARTIAVTGACPCGVGYIPMFESVDSGSTYRCSGGHPIVFDVASPEQRKEQYAVIETLKTDLAAARANAIDMTRLSQSEVFDLVQAALAHLDSDSLWKVRKLVAVAEETKAGKW